jgi:hypothetical protein
MEREPGSARCLPKKWRTRRIAWIAAEPPTRAGGVSDESWFVLWPHRTTRGAARTRPWRIPQNKAWKHGERPPRCALDARLDALRREGSGAWHPTGNQAETWTFLDGVIAA